MLYATVSSVSTAMFLTNFEKLNWNCQNDKKTEKLRPKEMKTKIQTNAHIQKHSQWIYIFNKKCLSFYVRLFKLTDTWMCKMYKKKKTTHCTISSFFFIHSRSLSLFRMYFALLIIFIPYAHCNQADLTNMIYQHKDTHIKRFRVNRFFSSLVWTSNQTKVHTQE